jgi:hypothetical protein
VLELDIVHFPIGGGDHDHHVDQSFLRCDRANLATIRSFMRAALRPNAGRPNPTIVHSAHHYLRVFDA